MLFAILAIPSASAADIGILAPFGTTDFGETLTGGDFDGDGAADLVASGRDLYSPWGEILLHLYEAPASAPGSSAVLQPSLVWSFDENAIRAPALASADVNGDGFDDLLVGIGSSTRWQYDAGYVEVWLGSSAGLGSTPSATLEGFAFADWFGTSVASAGDVNGDGYEDVVIGADYGDDPIGASTGAVHVYAGSPSGLVEPPLASFVGSAQFDHLGSHVSTGGDVNGDGYDDVVLSAPDAEAGRGRVSLHLGGPSGPSPVHLQTLVGPDDPARIEAMIVGDVDADGFADAVLRVQPTAVSAESLTLFRGSPAGFVPDGDLAFPSVSGAIPARGGDVNGDGYDDVVFGSRWIDRTHVWTGGPNGPARLAVRGVNGVAGGLGWSAVGIGDADADGDDEIAVGGIFTATHGMVLILDGHPDPVVTAPPEASAGDSLAIEVRSASADASVRLIASPRVVREGTCYDEAAGLCDGLANARDLGGAVTDASGVATFGVEVPATVPVGTTAWFESVETGGGPYWVTAERSAPVPVVRVP